MAQRPYDENSRAIDAGETEEFREKTRLPSFQLLSSRFHAFTFQVRSSAFQFTFTTKPGTSVRSTICATTHRILSGLNRMRGLEACQ